MIAIIVLKRDTREREREGEREREREREKERERERETHHNRFSQPASKCGARVEKLFSKIKNKHKIDMEKSRKNNDWIK